MAIAVPTTVGGAYGVSISSDLTLDVPAGCAAPAPRAHVELFEGTPDDFGIAPSAEDDRDWFLCHALADGSYHLRWRDFYELRIEASGRRIVYRAIDGCHPDVLRNFLFPQILSFALVLQGIEPLHAAAVVVGDEAVAFLGDCTFGKSTLAASFVGDGYRLLTDDLLVLDRRNGEWMAWPGSGRIKLQPHVAHLVGARGEGVRLNPQTAKQVFSLAAGQIERAPRRLRAIFVLPSPAERDAAQSIEVVSMPGVAVFQHLLKNSFNAHVVGARRVERHFLFATNLAEEVSACAVRYPPGVDRLPAVRTAILERLETIRVDDMRPS